MSFLRSVSVTLALGTLPPASFTATGIVGGGTATGTGVGAVWGVNAGVGPTGTTTATLPVTAARPISEIQIVIAGNGPGAFAGSAGGSMLASGVANVRGFGGFTLLGIPVNVGVPGTSIPPSGYGIAITAFANAWTTKTTVIPLVTSMGAPMVTSMGATAVTMMGTNGLVGGAGTVALVSALSILTNLQ